VRRDSHVNVVVANRASYIAAKNIKKFSAISTTQYPAARKVPGIFPSEMRIGSTVSLVSLSVLERKVMTHSDISIFDRKIESNI
jgi:hypothetical protein